MAPDSQNGHGIGPTSTTDNASVNSSSRMIDDKIRHELEAHRGALPLICKKLGIKAQFTATIEFNLPGASGTQTSVSSSNSENPVKAYQDCAAAFNDRLFGTEASRAMFTKQLQASDPLQADSLTSALLMYGSKADAASGQILLTQLRRTFAPDVTRPQQAITGLEASSSSTDLVLKRKRSQQDDPQADMDWVSLLNRHCQQRRKPEPDYIYSPHGSGFGATCEFDGDSFDAQMWFPTKKVAKQMAAREAVLSLRGEGIRI